MDTEPVEREAKVGQNDAPLWLAHGEILVSGLIPWGSNYTFLVTVKHRGLERRAIYKPRRGEAPLWDFPHGTLHRRELAAFLVSGVLGWPRVPSTVIRRGPLGIGSLQAYVDADLEANYFTFGAMYRRQMQQIALFDVLVNNADRKAGHCLLDVEGNVWAIDHGLTFHVEPKLRTVIWEFSAQRVPDALLSDLSHVRSILSASDRLSIALQRLLSPAEVGALLERIDSVLHRPVFPSPSTRRSVPWPPV